MKIFLLPTAVCCLALSACTSIPLAHPDKVPLLVQQVQCELKQAYDELTKREENAWLKTWAAGFTLTMKSDQSGSAAAEASLLGPFGAGSYVLPIGGGVSGDGLRTATAKYTLKLDKLDLVTCDSATIPQIEGSIGIKEWLTQTADPPNTKSYRIPDTVGHTFQFALTYGAHVSPTYTLVRSKGNSGFSLSRTDTDIIDIALTDATPKPAQHVIIDNRPERQPGGRKGFSLFMNRSQQTSPLMVRGYLKPKNAGSSIPDDARQRIDNQLYELQLRNLLGR